MKGNEILNKTGCLSPEAFEAARKDELKDNQWVIFDNHIKDCEICSDAYDGLLITEDLSVVDNLRAELKKNRKIRSIKSNKNLIAFMSAAASIIIIFGVYFLVNTHNQDQSTGLAEFIIQSDNQELNRPVPSDNTFNDGSDAGVSLSDQSGNKVFSPGSKAISNNFKGEVFTYSEEMPEYPGGILELDEFIKSEVAKAEKEKNIRSCGKVYVEFMINEKGEVINPVIVSGRSKKLNKVALDIIKKLPNWKPGYQSGEAVNVALTLPVKFENC